MNAPIEPRVYEARLNITYGGANGDYVEPVSFDLSDAELMRLAAEAIGAGLLGAPPAHVDLGEHVVDRFGATERTPVNRIFLRPKTPFG